MVTLHNGLIIIYCINELVWLYFIIVIYPLDIALYPTFVQLGLIQILWSSSLRYAICFSDRNHLGKLVIRASSPNKQLNLDHPITVGSWPMNLRSYA